jgi:hypothetical protein
MWPVRSARWHLDRSMRSPAASRRWRTQRITGAHSVWSHRRRASKVRDVYVWRRAVLWRRAVRMLRRMPWILVGGRKRRTWLGRHLVRCVAIRWKRTSRWSGKRGLRWTVEVSHARRDRRPTRTHVARTVPEIPASIHWRAIKQFFRLGRKAPFVGVSREAALDKVPGPIVGPVGTGPGPAPAAGHASVAKLRAPAPSPARARESTAAGSHAPPPSPAAARGRRSPASPAVEVRGRRGKRRTWVVAASRRVRTSPASAAVRCQGRVAWRPSPAPRSAPWPGLVPVAGRIRMMRRGRRSGRAPLQIARVVRIVL